ncbi:hypothetical protein FGO68_gene16961 [Halteria grandinella]|uniref:Uncharacterized protein n=1 Tax=Halteria grandinella TaxID=5974 RepID=A0A8J8NPR1_HALGN|nr:hypothetical protein FGO68_gene16961 [Halteria grandinella]
MHLLQLFESRVHHFTRFNRLVDEFKIERSLQRFAEGCRAVTKEFVDISLRVKDIDSIVFHPLSGRLPEHRLSTRIKEVQSLEKDHLNLRAQINDRLVKIAATIYDMHKDRALLLGRHECGHSHDHEGGEVISDAEWREEVDKVAQTMGKEVDGWKREEAKVMGEINEEVEAIRRLVHSEDDDDY